MCQLNTDPMKSQVSVASTSILPSLRMGKLFLSLWQLNDKEESHFWQNHSKHRKKFLSHLLFTFNLRGRSGESYSIVIRTGMMKSRIINDKLGNMMKIEFIFVFLKSTLESYDTCLFPRDKGKKLFFLELWCCWDGLLGKFLFIFCLVSCWNIFLFCLWMVFSDWISWRGDPTWLHSWRNVIGCNCAWR